MMDQGSVSDIDVFSSMSESPVVTNTKKREIVRVTDVPSSSREDGSFSGCAIFKIVENSTRGKSKTIDSDNSKSVLNTEGKVGEKLRDNFCRLLSRNEPQFVTCRQCILQVKRARIFPDSRKQIPHLLSHIKLHQDIIRDDDNKEGKDERVSLKRTKKTVFKKKSTRLKKMKIVAQTNCSSASRSDHQQSLSLDISTGMNLVPQEITATAVNMVPCAPDEEAEKVAIPDKKEIYSCSNCEVNITSLDDFITHSISAHNQSKFAVRFGVKELGKTTVNNLSKNEATIGQDTQSPILSLKNESDGVNDLAHVSFPDSQMKLEEMPGSSVGIGRKNYVNNDVFCYDFDGSEVIRHDVTSDNKQKLVQKESPEHILSEAPDSKKGVDGESKDFRGLFLCIECGDAECDCFNLREHMTRMHGDRSRVFVCKTCSTTWSEKNFHLFEKHMNIHHLGEEIFCLFCHLTFKTCADIRYHQAQHRPPLNFCCPYCYQEYSWILEIEFTNHICEHQGEEIPYQCHECSERFDDFVARREHQTTRGHDLQLLKFHDDLRPYICTGCGKQFVNSGKSTGVRALRQHICHSGVTLDPRFECQYCKCQFPLERSLRQHMREKHEQHMCHVCGTVCRSKATLDEHVGSEHYGSQFPCPICHETFDTSQKMKQHKTREHSTRDYICEFCGHDFAARLLLVRHLKKHDEFQGFVCSVCGDKFLLADRLETHFRKYHAHVVSDQEYETIMLENVQTAIATETIAIIQDQ